MEDTLNLNDKLYTFPTAFFTGFVGYHFLDNPYMLVLISLVASLWWYY